MKKQIVIVIDDVRHDFNYIKKRSVHAPLMVISIDKIINNVAHGSTAVDKSDIRVIKRNKMYHLISGYDKIAMAVNSAECPTSIEVKIMSQKYLDSTVIQDTPVAIVPIVEAPIVEVLEPIVINSNLSLNNIEDKFKEAGFKVSRQ